MDDGPRDRRLLIPVAFAVCLAVLPVASADCYSGDCGGGRAAARTSNFENTEKSTHLHNDVRDSRSRTHAGLPANASVLPPLLLFALPSDLHDKWGLIQHYDNVVQPASVSVGALGFPVPTAQCAFTGAKVLYVARTGGPDVDTGPIEMFWVCKPHIRMISDVLALSCSTGHR